MNETHRWTDFGHNVSVNFVPLLVTEQVVRYLTYLQTRFIVNGYISFTLSVLGAATNLINSLVFYRQGLKERMNLCLFCLALADLAFSLSVLGSSLVTVFCHQRICGVTDEHLLKNIVYVTGITYAFRAASGCYTMVIAVERCLCVTFPLRATSLISTTTMGVVFTSITFVLQLGFLVIPLKYVVVSTVASDTVQWTLVTSALYLNNRLLLDTILDTILGISIPVSTFLVVSMATAITVVKLRASMLWREKVATTSVGNRSQQTALTSMLVAVSCTYIASMVPFVLIMCSSLVVPDFSGSGAYKFLFEISHMIANVFPLINSSVNIFIYYFRSSRFRSVAASLLPRRGKRFSSETKSTINTMTFFFRE